MKKNLVFYCFFSDIKNIDEPTLLSLNLLREYKNVFSGQKIIYAAFDDPQSINFNDLKEVFSFFTDPQIKIVPNNSENRESEYFIESLKNIIDVNSLTFYAHNKGSTHKLDSSLKNWILAMFFFNLEMKVDISNDIIFSGILRKIVKINDLDCDWHYSGAFFWFNTKNLFAIKNWDVMKKGRMSLESYPGNKVNLERSQSKFVSEFYNFHMNDELWEKTICPGLIGEDLYKKYITIWKKL